MKYVIALVVVVIVVMVIRKKKMTETAAAAAPKKQWEVNAIPANTPPSYVGSSNMIPSTQVVLVAGQQPNTNQVMQVNPSFQTNVTVL